eukprot:6215884-Amphidinium_carterae.1
MKSLTLSAKLVSNFFHHTKHGRHQCNSDRRRKLDLPACIEARLHHVLRAEMDAIPSKPDYLSAEFFDGFEGISRCELQHVCSQNERQSAPDHM